MAEAEYVREGGLGEGEGRLLMEPIDEDWARVATELLASAEFAVESARVIRFWDDVADMNE